LAALPRPVVGYVGAISDWFDQEMLAAAARSHPNGRLFWSVLWTPMYRF
jgi:hypothetical protein